jgi:hypothetical protein
MAIHRGARTHARRDTMISLATGIALIVISVGLFIWLPPEGRVTTGPSTWGGGIVMPVLIIALGIAGLVFMLKPFSP